MNDSLFAPAPRRKWGVILMLAGSCLFHGALIGVAAHWPSHPSVEKPTVTMIGMDDLSVTPGESLAPPAVPPDESDRVPPVLTATEPIDNPPPVLEPNVDDMTLSPPLPRPVARTSFRPSFQSAVTSTIHSQVASANNGRASGTTGHRGFGHTGAGVVWNTPKPVYPASLRLAHIQGRGSVRVTTDGSGRVVSANVVQSTGNALLDDNTCRAARSDWSGPPNSTTSVPITYLLQ